MFRIKICGVTRVQDALMVAHSGADAIGLNFYPPSPRYLPTDDAQRIVQALPRGITKVGVFVNATVQEIVEVSDRLRLDIIQLHGDESPEMVARLGQRPVIKAFRCKTCKPDEMVGAIEACRLLGISLAGILLDAYSPVDYGGTGIALDWDAVSKVKSHLDGLPLVLAGGLNPRNVDQAIQAARPSAVDTASGVESSPGIKDPDLTRAFTRNASAAFAQQS